MADEDTKIVTSYIEELLDIAETKLEPSDEAIGYKSHISEVFSDSVDGEVHRVFVQMYTRCELPLVPKSVDLGFTKDDVMCHSGIILANLTDSTEPPEYVGVALEPDQFYIEFGISKDLAKRMNSQFLKQMHMALPKDSFLEKTSSMYHDRLVGNTGIISERVYC